MIYVTHDQTEALTFADQVVVMKDGEIVQIGTPVELFEQPQHTFVGHFIGSPGMNVLPCEVENGGRGIRRPPDRQRQCRRLSRQWQELELGVRPEFVSLAPDGIPVEIVKVARCRALPDRRVARRRTARIKLLVPRGRDRAAGQAPCPLRPGSHANLCKTAGW